MDLEQWTVGGRGFGLVLVWLLMAGEIYTTFTFLGASGWAYSRGAPILFNLGQAPLIYVTSFYILPLIWEVGRRQPPNTSGFLPGAIRQHIFGCLRGPRWRRVSRSLCATPTHWLGTDRRNGELWGVIARPQ